MMLMQALDVVGNIAFYMAAFIVVLTIVVFIHELGHFKVARWCGVSVKAFSIGFGKELWHRVDRHGTRWRIAALPLGGYVKFVDDDNGASMPSQESADRLSAAEREGSFHAKPVWKRAAIVAAGPIANFLLAIAIFAAMAMIWGVTRLEPRVGGVLPDSPAAEAGFQAGDLVLSINDRPIEDFSDLIHMVSTSPERVLTFEVDRGGVIRKLTVTPKLRDHEDRLAGKHSRPMIGIKSSDELSYYKHSSLGPIQAIKFGIDRTYQIGDATVSYIGNILTRRQSADQLGGPLMIAEASGKMAKLGVDHFVQFVALISVSIGLLNLFPIPLLDGGHLLFYAIEALRRKPLSPRAQDIGFRIGIAFVAGLMLIANFNDISRWTRWFGLG